MWEDPDGAGDTESLSSDEFSLPVEQASQPSHESASLPFSEWINSTLLRNL